MPNSLSLVIAVIFANKYTCMHVDRYLVKADTTWKGGN